MSLDHGLGRCILWLREDGAVPAELAAALRRAELETAIVRSPADVMLELGEAGAEIVLIAEPQEQPRLNELREAVDQYFPGVRCWRYIAAGASGQGQPRLEPFEDGGHPSHGPSPQASETVARVKGANQRLRSLVVKVNAPGEYGPLVSDEEMAMLLGPEQGPAFAGGEEKGPRRVPPG